MSEFSNVLGAAMAMPPMGGLALAGNAPASADPAGTRDASDINALAVWLSKGDAAEQSPPRRPTASAARAAYATL